jgi:GNAT superfamily N-acetyltransferase
MQHLSYFYLRALEMEGTHPQDAGAWPSTYLRMEVGEGFPWPGSDWDVHTFADEGPFPPTRRPPPALMVRHFCYRTIRSAVECEQHLQRNVENTPQVFFHLTPAWADPPGGMIPPPTAGDIVLEQTHAARVFGCIPERRLFRIALLWSGWGDKGTGYMPYDYFDQRGIGCWVTYGAPDSLRLFRERRLDSQHVRWSAEDAEGHRLYGFEVRTDQSIEKHAWAFVIERDGALEVEELFVRPEFRRIGHGRWLAEQVAKMAREKGQPLRAWVSFADCQSVNPANYLALVATARRMGVRFQPCPVPWAAYLATNEKSGEELPIPPARVPQRPRMPKNELLAIVAALGIGGAVPSAPTSQSPAAIAEARAAVVVGTQEWDELTQRRAELIYKKNRGGLSTDEQAEFDQLQARSREAIARKFPVSGDLLDQLASLKEKLAAAEDARRE